MATLFLMLTSKMTIDAVGIDKALKTTLSRFFIWLLILWGQWWKENCLGKESISLFLGENSKSKCEKKETYSLLLLSILMKELQRLSFCLLVRFSIDNLCYACSWELSDKRIDFMM